MGAEVKVTFVEIPELSKLLDLGPRLGQNIVVIASSSVRNV